MLLGSPPSSTHVALRAGAPAVIIGRSNFASEPNQISRNHIEFYVAESGELVVHGNSWNASYLMVSGFSDPRKIERGDTIPAPLGCQIALDKKHDYWARVTQAQR